MLFYEFVLSATVAINIVAALTSDMLFQRRIFIGYVKVAAQIVSKCQMAHCARAVPLEDMNLMRPFFTAFFKVQATGNTVFAAIAVVDSAKSRNVLLEQIQVIGFDQDVYYRLCRQPRRRRCIGTHASVDLGADLPNGVLGS